MEIIKSKEDIAKLEKNRVEGNPEISNSKISFKGINNILFCEGNVKITNANFAFEGNNSIVYLSSAMNSLNINIQESQNVIIGAECSLSSGVNIRTADIHPIYDNKTMQRVNPAQSVFIGDHVWIGHLAYISRGVKIGSGAIVDNYSFVPHNARIHSNSLVVGNPVRVEKDNVFFTKEFLGYHTAEDSMNTQDYKSDVFIYEFINQETLNLNQIDKILKELSVEDRLEFIQKLFVRNKRKNRFSIK